MQLFGGRLKLFEWNKPQQLEVKGGDNKIPALDGMESNQTYWALLSAVRRISEGRSNKLKQYKRMGHHTTINAALEMISEDATQLDQERRQIFWVESEDQNIEDELNKFLYEKVRIQDRIFMWAYLIGRDGECFLKTFYSERKDAVQTKTTVEKKLLELKSLNENEDSNSFKIRKEKQKLIEETTLSEAKKKELEVLDVDEYYEEVEDSSKISNLTLYGKTFGFLDTQDDSNTVLYQPQDFVHFCSDRNLNRESLEVPYKNKEGKEDKRTFKIKYGTSYLEGVVQDFNVIELLENVMIVSRLSRSPLFRLFSLNVGGSSNEEAIAAVRSFKNAIKTHESINVRDGNYSSANSPLPLAESIIVPTRPGKGDVSMQEIGGQVDVRSIVDFDFFWNKFCAALRIPAVFLGGQDAIGGQFSNTSLTRLDIKYARSVKRLVTVLQSGIENLINHHLESIGKEEWKGKFTIKSTPVSDAEESDRLQDLTTRFDIVNSFASNLTAVEGAFSPLQQKALIWHMVETKTGLNIEEIVNAYKEKHPEEEEVVPDDGMEGEGELGADDGSGGGDDLGDLEAQLNALG